MATELEQVGRLYCETQRLLAEYQKLLGLLQQIADGQVMPDQVTVDMTALSWSIAMTGSQFAEAITAKPTEPEEDHGDAT